MNLTTSFWNKIKHELFGSCKIIDYDMLDFKNHTPTWLSFKIGKVDSAGISLYIEERNKALARRLSFQNTFSYSGTLLTIPRLSDPKRLETGMKLSQIIDSERDSNKRCKNYPNEQYLSFRSCDETNVYENFKRWIGFMPFYAAKHIEEVTISR